MISRYEERKKRFDKIFPKRVINVLNSIELLGKCSNRYNYAFDIEYVKERLYEIRRKLEITEFMFFHGYSKKESINENKKEGDKNV